MIAGSTAGGHPCLTPSGAEVYTFPEERSGKGSERLRQNAGGENVPAPDFCAGGFLVFFPMMELAKETDTRMEAVQGGVPVSKDLAIVYGGPLSDLQNICLADTLQRAIRLSPEKKNPLHRFRWKRNNAHLR